MSDGRKEVTRLTQPGVTGWRFVEAAMERQIEAGLTTAEAYHEHFEASGYMDSWLAYQAWRKDHPGKPVPEEINQIPEAGP